MVKKATPEIIAAANAKYTAEWWAEQQRIHEEKVREHGRSQAGS